MNIITIEPRPNGTHRVRFPYKPSPAAIRGFHNIVTATGIQMHWDGSALTGDVYWIIPAGNAVRARRPCIEEAVEMIRDWYGDYQNGQSRQGQPACMVVVAEVENPAALAA